VPSGVVTRTATVLVPFGTVAVIFVPDASANSNADRHFCSASAADLLGGQRGGVVADGVEDQARARGCRHCFL
jgi:hypothetical protein